MQSLIIAVTAAVFTGLAIMGYVAYLVTNPRPPMFEGDGDDE